MSSSGLRLFLPCPSSHAGPFSGSGGERTFVAFGPLIRSPPCQQRDSDYDLRDEDRNLDR